MDKENNNESLNFAPWSASEIVSFCKGQLIGQTFQVTNISTDTRTLRRGDLFIALNGANFCGEDFVEQARQKGAVAAIVANHQQINLPQIIVKDTLEALTTLARKRRDYSSATFFAITGSNGKTTTKEILTQILKRQAATLATSGNFNNQIGVPLTLLQLKKEHRYVALEVGANQFGEVARLTAIINPDIAIVTNVSEAHLQGFHTLGGVFRAKGEIYAESDGAMVINLDLSQANRWLKAYGTRPHRTFSLRQKADYYASDIKHGKNGSSFNLCHGDLLLPINWRLKGEHNIANALAACAAAALAGISPLLMQRALNEIVPQCGRIREISWHKHLIYDDTYNANPASFRAAIDLLTQRGNLKNTLIIAGDMGELGDGSAAWHCQVAQYALQKGIGAFWALGAHAENYKQGYPKAIVFGHLEYICEELQKFINKKERFYILVKGSRSAKMERIFNELRIGNAARAAVNFGE